MMSPRRRVALVLIALFLILLLTSATEAHSDALAPESPLPTPAFPSTYLTEPPSKAGLIALEYLSLTQRLDADSLRVSEEEVFQFPTLGRVATLITVTQAGRALEDPIYVFVDTSLGNVIEDGNALFREEQEAYAARYGKLSPSLYDVLQKMMSDERVPIAIWMIVPDVSRVRETVRDEVAALYPEADIARRTNGVLWSVEDRARADEIRYAYLERLRERMEAITSPLIKWLETQGISATQSAGMPVIFADVPRSLILELSEREDVDTLYYGGTEGQPALNIAIPTDRVSSVWQRQTVSGKRLSGTGINIAILERNNLSGTAVPPCLRIVAVRPALTVTPNDQHKNRVAASAACNDLTLRGPAFDANILDVGREYGENEAVRALGWVVTPMPPNSAHIVNESESFTYATNNNRISLLDQAYDYWVYEAGITAVISAGNEGTGDGQVTTPAKAYNVISVGNVDDSSTMFWSDDSMRPSSSYANPVNGIEKPELAASGSSINTVAGADSGTSFAAPQVAGVAALLMERNPELRDWPSAVKAVLLASAVHNVEGTSRLSSKDGAGAIDAMLADTIAQNLSNSARCDGPCWWHRHIARTEPPVGSNMEYIIHVLQGEEVRVVISWLAHGNAANTISELRSNLDLSIKRWDNFDVIASSTRFQHNYEIVEFTAPYTGLYRVHIFRKNELSTDPNGPKDTDEWNYLAVAWSKQAAYAPDIRNDGAWTSSVYLRSDEPTDRDTFVVYRDDGGASTNYPLVLHPNESVQRPPFGVVQGAAVINGHEDLVSVYGMSANVGGLATLDNVFRPPGYGDPAFEQVSATLYLPALYRAIYGNSTSVIDIQNVGSEGMQPTLRLFGRSGYGDYSPPALSFIPSGGHLRFDLNSLALGAWAGSGYISATQPLAVRVLTRDGAGRYAYTYNAAAQGTTLSYTPVGYRTSPGLSTALVIQNTGTEAITPANPVTLTFRNRQTQISATRTITQLASLRTVALNASSVVTNGWSGSITIDSRQGAGGVPVVALVVNTNADSAGTVIGSYATTAVTAAYGGRLTVLPYAVRNINGRNTGWTVRNINGLSVDVTARYYDSSGSLSGSRTFAVAAPGGTVGYAQGGDTFLPTGWQGSIVLESTGAIVAVMREDGPNTIAGYNGVVLSQ